MESKKILFIVRGYFWNGAQSIRFQNLLRYLSNDFEIHLLFSSLAGDSEDIKEDCNITFHKVNYSNVGEFFNSQKLPFFKKVIRKIIKKFVLPDIYIFERKQILKKAVDICLQNEINIVVGSGFPFTIESIGSKIKQTIPEIKFIYDIGDPFYGNSTNDVLKRFYSKYYETRYLKYVDILVVTNEVTKMHYLKHFSLLEQNVIVIPQGATPVRFNKKDSTLDSKVSFIYAGQFYRDIRNPNRLFKAFERVSNGFNNIELNIYGNTSDSFKKSTNEGIKFFNSVPQIDLYNHYSMSNVIVFLDNKYGMQMPGKVFELILLKKPLLVIYDNIDSPSLLYFRKYRGCIIVKNNIPEIEKAIIGIIEKTTVFDFSQSFDFSWRNRAIDFKRVFDNV